MTSEFRRIYHYHAIPGPPGLLPWDSPSLTGDLHAFSRNLAPLALAFSSIGRVAGLPAAHYLSGGAVAFALLFGVRQGMHSVVLQQRRLRALRAVRCMLEQRQRNEGPSTNISALLLQNSRSRREALLATTMASSATLGSLGIAVGTLLREPVLGGVLHALTAAAMPILFAALAPLALPAAVTIADRAFRIGRTYGTQQRIDALLALVDLPHTPLVRDLYRRRQRELRRFYACEIAARSTLTAGAFATVFSGPIGLAVLIPGILAALAVDVSGRRYLNVDDALSLEKRLQLLTQDQVHEFIYRVNRDVEAAEQLRQLKKVIYPAGWTTPLRPFLKVVRAMRRPSRGLPDAQHTLARFAARHAGREGEIALKPLHLFMLFADLELFDPFAQTLLRSRSLRRAFDGQGIFREGNKWSLQGVPLAAFLERQLERGPTERQQVDKVYRKAEEVLLTHGKVELLRRRRAILKFLEDFLTEQASAASRPRAERV